MAYFYGWSPHIIDNMDFKQFNIYYNCINLIKSENNLELSTITSFPHVKKQGREKLWKKWKQTLRRGIIRKNNKPISLEELLQGSNYE